MCPGWQTVVPVGDIFISKCLFSFSKHTFRSDQSLLNDAGVKKTTAAAALISACRVNSRGFSALISVLTSTALAHSSNKVVKLNSQIYQFKASF